MRIVNKMVGKPSPLFSTKAQILLPVARPCTVSPSPGLLLGCRPLNDINDGWPVGSGDQPPPPSRCCLENTIIWLHRLSPHCALRTEDTRQPLLHHPLCRVKPRYDKFKILRLPPAAAAARQPSSQAAKHALTRVIYHSAASSGWGGAGALLGTVNTGSEKAKGWKPTEIAKAYYDI